MKVKSKIVARYEDKGRLKAVATVCLDGKFLVTGVRVADCQKGPAVFMPSREIRAGEYRDICFPITSELYKDQNNQSVVDQIGNMVRFGRSQQIYPYRMLDEWQ